ncbi:Uncharacterized protein DAT39_008942 [Clarias magur]|uniref:Uncharacterized protein n=1 Tax=Clarias magur TaxID=1594786 RepID=A0A8J4XBV1_CLAMG|nr:Uncharacterized protein DAT39_008942 [Clarias magur]
MDKGRRLIGSVVLLCIWTGVMFYDLSHPLCTLREYSSCLLSAIGPDVRHDLVTIVSSFGQGLLFRTTLLYLS